MCWSKRKKKKQTKTQSHRCKSAGNCRESAQAVKKQYTLPKYTHTHTGEKESWLYVTDTQTLVHRHKLLQTIKKKQTNKQKAHTQQVKLKAERAETGRERPTQPTNKQKQPRRGASVAGKTKCRRAD